MENAANKSAATDFLKKVVAGQIEQAYATWVSPQFKHHNVYFPGDAASLMQGMQENHAKFPSKIFEIKTIIAENDRVMTHSHLRFQEGEAGMSVIHVFRFEHGKIVELWDLGQVIPADSPNKNGAF